AAGVVLDSAASGTDVSNNQVGTNDIGILNYSAGSTIGGNILSGNALAGLVLGQGSAAVTRNTISGGLFGVAAITFCNDAAPATGNLSGNDITGNGTGIQVYSQGAESGAVPLVT